MFKICLAQMFMSTEKSKYFGLGTLTLNTSINALKNLTGIDHHMEILSPRNS